MARRQNSLPATKAQVPPRGVMSRADCAEDAPLVARYLALMRPPPDEERQRRRRERWTPRSNVPKPRPYAVPSIDPGRPLASGRRESFAPIVVLATHYCSIWLCTKSVFVSDLNLHAAQMTCRLKRAKLQTAITPAILTFGTPPGAPAPSSIWGSPLSPPSQVLVCVFCGILSAPSDAAPLI